MKPRTFICSPYRGDVQRNTEYARACMLDSLQRGEAPYVPHLLYTQVLDDSDPELRARGMAAGAAWLASSTLLAVYEDFSLSEGMTAEVLEAMGLGITIVYRRLPKALMKRFALEAAA